LICFEGGDMKAKFIVVLLAVVLVLAFTACGGGGDEGGDAGVVGEWKLTSAEAGGQTLGEDMLGSFQYSFTFGDDGKASVSAMGQSYDGVAYKLDGDTVTFDDPSVQAITLKLDGGKLVFEEATTGTKLFFEK
jgi:hypothetical protein